MLITDYVVIGAGLTGLGISTRLTENSGVTVTVLEAGSANFHDVNIDTPALLLNNLGVPTKDWSFFSTPQDSLGGRPVFLPRGKGLGGSTLINFMEVNRATVAEYDVWSKLGSSGWTWKSLLPYFRKSETLIAPLEESKKLAMSFDPQFQGTNGPVQRTIPHFLDVVATPWQAGAKSLGFAANADPNDGDNTGVWTSTRTVDRKSIRSTSASAYYEPNRSRRNLNVITGALATKLLTTGTGSNVVVTGVQYLVNGTVVQTVTARKEVIIAAGTYQTPQILELSGIGDPAILKKFNIPVVVNLPGVGANLQEHASATYTAELTPGHTTWENMTDPAFAASQQKLYDTNGTGMLAGIPSAFAFLPFSSFDKSGTIAKAVSKLSLPNTPAFCAQQDWVKQNVPFLELSGFDRFQPGRLAAPLPGTNYMSSSIILLHPFSRGSVHITGTDASTPPAIDINFLDKAVDTQIMVQGFRLARQIAQSGPFKAHFAKEVSPGADLQTDAQLADFLKQTVGTTFHPIGTAALLPRQDGGVVDANLKVYGTKNLRIIDASVIPTHISAHLQATLYAMAEKAADIIKAAQ